MIFFSENDNYEFLSQSRADGDALSLRGPHLDQMKNFVQNQIEQDMVADQAKGRKSPSTNKTSASRRNTSGKNVHTPTHSREPELPDHQSDTTEVERYNSTPTDTNNVTEAIMHLASQMDKTDIDKTIAVLMHLRHVIDTPGANQVPRRSNIEVQTNQNLRRANSGPPGMWANRSPYSYTNAGDSDNEEVEAEVRHHNDYDRYSFIPPAGQKHVSFRPESEVSLNTANSGSRTSTPAHKRSPTPVAYHGIEHCPIVDRHYTSSVVITQAEQDYVTVVSNLAKTGFSRPPLSREASASSGLQSPTSPRYNNDDLISVGSSNSSFTQVTVNSTGNFSYTGKNR